MSFDLKSTKKQKRKEKEAEVVNSWGSSVQELQPRTSRAWSPQQLAIFEFCKSKTNNLLVEALAGTGKTTTAVEAINYLPKPSRIILCAFNKRIADELKSRVPYETAEVATMHSLGYRLVRRLWPDAQVDDKRGYKLALKASAKVGASLDRPTQQCIQNLASISKEVAPYANSWNDLVGVGHAFGSFDGLFGSEKHIEKVAQAAWESRILCLERPEAGSGVDFSDMLFIPLQKNLTRGEFDVVIPDEAQDWNKAQLELAQKVLKKEGRIIIFGDKHQAIYGFRGADSGSLDRLQKKFNCTVLPLSTTYRCPKNVVAVAQQFVPAFQAADSAPEGKVTTAWEGELSKLAKPGDFIVSRLNAPLMGICLDLVKKGVKCRIEGRDIGKGLTAIIWKLKARTLDDLEGLLDEWEYRGIQRAKEDENRATQITDQAAAIRSLADHCSSVDELCTTIDSLFADTGGKGDTVICSSVHKVKGLEAKRVFILADTFRVDPQHGGIKKDKIQIPGQLGLRSKPGKSSTSEEANLAYVAVTRAQEELVFVRRSVEPEQGIVITQIKTDPEVGF